MLENIKILAVDDHQDTLAFIELSLKLLGAKVATSTSVPRAKEIINHWQPDVLLCDLVMPDQTGFDLLDEIKKQDKPICTIAVSGYGAKEKRQEVLARGFQEYLTKPIDIDELAKIIDQTCINKN